jgi:hypothetical protein
VGSCTHIRAVGANQALPLVSKIKFFESLYRSKPKDYLYHIKRHYEHMIYDIKITDDCQWTEVADIGLS